MGSPVYRDAANAGSIPVSALASLSCDVAFISDHTTPPHVIVAREIDRLQDPQLSTLYWNTFDRMRGDYEAGGFLPHSAWIANRVRHAMAATSIEISPTKFAAALAFFDDVNQAMFEHQTLAWLAGSEFKLHLYGAGWENHPTFSPYARGAIEDDSTRLAIYRASRINLHAGAYGVVKQQLIDTITTGGFVLMRYCPADLIERFYPPIWEFCSSLQITSNEELAELATPGVRSLLAFAGRTIGLDILNQWPDFVAHVNRSADRAYTSSAATLWAQYPAVAFSTRDELIGLISKYLYDVPERQRLAEEMRRQLTTRFAHIRVARRAAAATNQSEVAA